MVLHYIGIDVGATWIRIALATEAGEIIKKVVLRTPREGDRYTIANAISNKIENEFGNVLRDVKAIGIGSAGPMDLATGIVINAPNIPIHTFELAKPLQEKFRKPVIMANDCIAGVWGEKVLGLGKEHENIVYVTISTGIGGGMIVNNTLLLGKMGNAHEIGHIVIDVSGKMKCGCGGYGHWEAYASGANIPRFASKLIEEWNLNEQEKESPIYKAYKDDALSSELIYAKAKEGDKLSLRIVDEINKYNIAGFINIINLYDPELIVVGGSVALKNKELVIDRIRDGVHKSTGVVTSIPKILPTKFEDDVVLMGAIALAMKPPENLVKMLKYLQL
ncbi:ROK family protein [Ignisphaera sp. 4213-co]|uniref:ROK family protein n=1 Tax=Ignisphaera cupida TaxID=3050454 RepID=A0ABD4Z3Y5_9CREN|nr:ROK family protein [Ignisphaera sp. 4213-co]MDK6028021.1 ROK family protein [Ignisphaera sp. 4213-co]